MAESTLKELLAILAGGDPLSAEQAIDAFEIIMTGGATPAQTGALLALMQARGPTVDEIAGAAIVMREKAQRVVVPEGLTVIDTCGTGGDQTGTFNISTAAALVAAGAGHSRGVAVAKHGNRSVTSRSGSSQVLESLGVKLSVGGETLTRCLGEAGICFCFAPAHHPAMKYAAPIRAELGFRTIFNLLGPLTNPARATRQVVGVFASRLTFTLASVLQHLGSEHAMVVHGRVPGGEGGHVDGLDELSTSGPSQISHLKGGKIDTYQFEPESVGLNFAHPHALKVGSPQESAATIRAVLEGKRGPASEIVCLNAAAALVVADAAEDFNEGLELASETIATGKAKAALETLARITQADKGA